MRRRLTALPVFLLCLALAGGPLAASELAGTTLLPDGAFADAEQAAAVPDGATWEQVWFPSGDGTMLRADVLLPTDRDPDDRHPVILSIGPYYGRNALNHGVGATGPVMRFADVIEGGDIFNRGYAWVQVDSRGFGGSGGCNDFGGRGEQMDTTAAVNWAATQDWSNGRVGMWGKSYDAWTQVMALAENPVGLKATVIQAPLIETYRGMWMNGVHYNTGWYITPSLYAAYDLAPATPGDPHPEEYLWTTAGTATNPDCYAENVAFPFVHERSIPYWQERDIVQLASMSEVPTIWTMGTNDVNTKPDNFLDVYTHLQGPKRAWFGQWAHDRANEVEYVGRDGFIDQAMDWFDHYLKGLPLVEHPGAEIQDNEGAWRSEAQWPPADATDHDLPVQPGTYADDASSSNDRGIWSITEPAPYDLRIAGEPRLSVDVDIQVPLANLVAQLYDIAPDGHATLITRGAYRLEESGEISFALYPNDWIVRPGHRLGLRISSYDSLFHTIGTQTDVELVDGALALPYLRWERVSDLEGGPTTRSTPTTTVDEETIEANTVEATFPPAMAPCDPETHDCPQDSGDPST